MDYKKNGLIIGFYLNLLLIFFFLFGLFYAVPFDEIEEGISKTGEKVIIAIISLFLISLEVLIFLKLSKKK